MEIQENCPCCHKHCPTTAPQCARGEEYAKTGVIPEKEHRKEHNHEKHHGKHGGRGHHHEPSQAVRPYAEQSMDEKLLTQMRNCGHVLRHHTEGKGGQGRILSILESQGPMTQRALVDIVDVSPAALSEVLGKLEANDWVDRTRSEEDKRHVDIRLTDGGVQAAQANRTEKGIKSQALFSALSEEEQVTLLELLEKLDADWKTRFEGMPMKGQGRVGHGHHRHHER